MKRNQELLTKLGNCSGVKLTRCNQAHLGAGKFKGDGEEELERRSESMGDRKTHGFSSSIARAYRTFYT